VFEGFETTRVATSGAEIALVRGGSGPPVLLLHGYPQMRAMWHLVAPILAEGFTVVATDMRGYGDSEKVPGSPPHVEYAKRTQAAEQVEVMAALGFDRFAVVGHDRGARVAHRMTLDHPERVSRVAMLDIVPTYDVFAAVDAQTARGMYHWFFLSQAFDLPERLIGADPAYFLRWNITRWTGDSVFAPEAVAEYQRCFADPGCIHATCEDYRAGATIDLEHDAADRDRKIACPLLAIWGARSEFLRRFDVLAVWRDRAENVTGRSLDCGHFLAEERPEETAAELEAFLSD
jgi:haloacetate dehalogenase